jgi:hypothetical protein
MVGKDPGYSIHEVHPPRLISIFLAAETNVSLALYELSFLLPLAVRTYIYWSGKVFSIATPPISAAKS